ncbi:MAG: FkbM family methyltransferase [Alistipes finegoldii]
MKTLIHKILYRTLPLEGYLRAVSRCSSSGSGSASGVTPRHEYVYHLPRLVRGRHGRRHRRQPRLLRPHALPAGRPGGQGLRRGAGSPILSVLRRNLRRCRNVEILPYALGTEDKAVTMANDSARATGYFGTGQNFVNDGGTSAAAEFPARMRRGSELFAGLERLDFIKCDIEGYEVVVMNELRPLLERFRPTVLIETGGENRPQIVALFTTLGYAGFTLDRGREIPLTPDTTKDIIFRHAH